MNALFTIITTTICFHTINAPIYKNIPGKSSEIVGEMVCIEAITRKLPGASVPLIGESAYFIVPEKK